MATTGCLVYVRGCNDKDKYAQIEILWTEHERKQGHNILTWKTQNRENPQGSTNPKKQNHYDERNYNKILRGNNLELFFVNK